MKKTNSGFSLAELLIVVVIIGAVAGLAIPAFTGYLAKSKSAEAGLQIGAIKAGLSVHYEESAVNATGGYHARRFLNIDDPRPPTIPAQTKEVVAWSNASGNWGLIRFQPSDALAFSYNVQASGEGTSSTATISATADLKSGLSRYTIRTMSCEALEGIPKCTALTNVSDE